MGTGRPAPRPARKSDYVYYAFGVHSGPCDFLVMPYREVQKQIDSGRVKASTKHRVTFVWDDKTAPGGMDVARYRRRRPEA